MSAHAMKWKQSKVSGTSVFELIGAGDERSLLATTFEKLIHEFVGSETEISLRIEFWSDIGKMYCFLTEQVTVSDSSGGMCVVSIPRLNRAYEEGRDRGEAALELYVKTAMLSLSDITENIVQAELESQRVKSVQRITLAFFDGDDFEAIYETALSRR